MISIASSASPVGSEIFASIALVVISFVVLVVLRYYLPLRTTPAYLLLPVFFALWLPAFIVLLVPIDLASSAAVESEEARGIWFPQRLLLVSWRITYWLTFVLTWYGNLVAHSLDVKCLCSPQQVHPSDPCRVLRCWLP
jgi:hypothetical protein